MQKSGFLILLKIGRHGKIAHIPTWHQSAGVLEGICPWMDTRPPVCHTLLQFFLLIYNCFPGPVRHLSL